MIETDVVIVGAGFAGLSAARALRDAGRSAIVLEARDRVGGRVLTKKIGGTWVDLGGQWLGPTQDRALALVRELGFETFSTWTRGDNLVVVEERAKRYRGTIPRLPIASLLNVGWAQWRFERLAKTVPLDAPWSAPRAAELDRKTLADWVDANVKTRVARRLLEAGLESVFAASASEMSLLHALFYVRSGRGLDMLLGTEGGAQATRVKGGMQPVATKLAEGLDVHLASPVRRIEHDDASVTAYHHGGGVRAKHAIVAIPPKLAAAIAFTPDVARTELARKMPMGAVIKHTAIYERPFWRERGLSGMVVSDDGPIHVVFDNSPPGDSPGVLMGFSEAHEARAMGAKTEAARRAAALACFARHFGEEAKDAIAYADHVWEHDEWSGGCYGAFMPPGVLTTLGPRLREPCGRVHWAGAETATEWCGYIDGAIASGRRAAAEILG
ncbi:MAG TPA: flavin monoamine oxidase family protein [Labilithrix sp.]